MTWFRIVKLVQIAHFIKKNFFCFDTAHIENIKINKTLHQGGANSPPGATWGQCAIICILHSNGFSAVR